MPINTTNMNTAFGNYIGSYVPFYNEQTNAISYSYTTTATGMPVTTIRLDIADVTSRTYAPRNMYGINPYEINLEDYQNLFKKIENPNKKKVSKYVQVEFEI